MKNNADTYRPKLGRNYNQALFELTALVNDDSLASNLAPVDLIRKWIERGCREAGISVPTGSKPYHRAI